MWPFWYKAAEDQMQPLYELIIIKQNLKMKKSRSRERIEAQSY